VNYSGAIVAGDFKEPQARKRVRAKVSQLISQLSQQFLVELIAGGTGART